MLRKDKNDLNETSVKYHRIIDSLERFGIFLANQNEKRKRKNY